MEKNTFFIDEENADVQEKYFHVLDKVMDAVVLLRYEKAKEMLIFVSLDQIHHFVFSHFQLITSTNKDYIFHQLVRKILWATEKENEKEFYLSQLSILYEKYQKNHVLYQKETTPFYNLLLNEQQDHFCQREKKLLIDELKNKLPLTKRKQTQLNNALLLKKINKQLKEGDLQPLGISRQKMLEMLGEVHDAVKEKEYFQKKESPITENEFLILDTLFLSGDLKIQNIPFSRSLKAKKIIVNSYEREMLNRISLTKDIDLKNTIANSSLTYDYNQFVIATNQNFQKNLKEIEAFDEQCVEKLESQEYQTLNLFVPLLNLIEDFNTNTFLMLFENYEKILAKIKDDNPSFHGSKEEILNQLKTMIQLAEVYHHTNPLTLSILNSEVVHSIINGEGRTSQNPFTYALVYRNMLQRVKTTIPTVKGNYLDYSYESGNSSDLMRVLIGKYCCGSCLGPGGSGERAYRMSLTGENADVLMIKDREGRFVARSLLFRKGNYIMMSTLQGMKEINPVLFRRELLEKIGREIIEKAEIAGDVLDYVFMIRRQGQYLPDFSLVHDPSLVANLPHCDWESEEAYLLYGRKREIELQEFSKSKWYDQRRKEPRMETSNFDEIMRLKALAVVSDVEGKYRQETIEDFSKTKLCDYQKAYLGQDFYIAYRKDGKMEIGGISVDDSRQQEEMLEFFHTNEPQKILSFSKKIR